MQERCHRTISHQCLYNYSLLGQLFHQPSGSFPLTLDLIPALIVLFSFPSWVKLVLPIFFGLKHTTFSLVPPSLCSVVYHNFLILAPVSVIMVQPADTACSLPFFNEIGQFIGSCLSSSVLFVKQTTVDVC